MPITSGYKPSPLQFSPSQVFFNQQKELLKSFGFFPTTSIDLYVKYSFQLVEETYFIKGGEVISYDMDHEEQGHAMVYQVGLLNPLQVVSNSWSMDLKDATDRIKNGIFSYIKNFPFWQWGGFLFFVCLLGLAGKFGEVLLWINVIGIVLMLLGFLVVGFGMCIYFRQALSCGPRDTLMIALGKRIDRIPIGLVNNLIFLVVTIVSWMLHAPIGLGTLIAVFGSGLMYQLSYRITRFDPKSVKHESFQDMIAARKS